MATVDWFFDFISPFAYLQSEQLAALGPRVRVRFRPVLFAALLAANGQKGPAEIARKRVFTYRFAVWQAKRQGIVLKMPLEGGGRLVVEMTADEIRALGDAIDNCEALA